MREILEDIIQEYKDDPTYLIPLLLAVSALTTEIIIFINNV